MKLNKTPLMMGFLAAFSLSAKSQSLQDTLSFISRAWKIESVSENMTNEMDSTEREKFKGASVVFKKDGVYTSYIGDKIAETGKWKYISGRRNIVCKSNDNESSTTLTIQAINENEIRAQTYFAEEVGVSFIVLKAIK